MSTCRSLSSRISSFAASAHFEKQFAASVAGSLGVSTLSVTLLQVASVAASATAATVARAQRTRGDPLSRSCMIDFLPDDGLARWSGGSGPFALHLHVVVHRVSDHPAPRLRLSKCRSAARSRNPAHGFKPRPAFHFSESYSNWARSHGSGDSSAAPNAPFST